MHSAEHVDTIEKTCKQNADYPDADTVMVKASWDAALLAAGGAIAACKAVLEGKVDNAFTAMRPPGHHAERDRAMGFCLFNNVAVAARWLRDVRGIGKVAILDWDVHHGNGTQHAFYDDDTVYYASMHQHPPIPARATRRARQEQHEPQRVNGVASGPKEWLAALDTQIIPEFERLPISAISRGLMRTRWTRCVPTARNRNLRGDDAARSISAADRFVRRRLPPRASSAIRRRAFQRAPRLNGNAHKPSFKQVRYLECGGRAVKRRHRFGCAYCATYDTHRRFVRARPCVSVFVHDGSTVRRTAKAASTRRRTPYRLLYSWNSRNNRT